MKGTFLFLLIIFCGALTQAHAQRYRNQNNLGVEERVKFIAYKNGDIVEFNWAINSTRDIKSIVLQKGSFDDKDVKWITVKEIKDEDKKYIDYLPDLGKVFYKLILVDGKGKSNEYQPEFKIKKDATALL